MIGLNEAYDSAPQTPDSARLAKLLFDQVDRIFASDGFLTRQLQLEFRPQQYEMATATALHMGEDLPLFFEAGTGVGKSLAYLVPAIIHACRQERKAVISTHTIALQEQIMHQDLAHCRRLFEAVPELETYAGFRTALMLGRGNYLCGTRLQQAIQQQQELFETAEQRELQTIAEWAKETEHGLIQELPSPPRPDIWEWVNSDASGCSPKRCQPNTCFYQKARQQLQQAQVIIVNHSLLMALIGAGFHPRKDIRGVLFPQDFLVVDEAHTLPAIAAEHLGDRISSLGTQRLLYRLYNPRRNKGLLVKHGDQWDRNAATEAIQAAEVFFNATRELLLSKRAIARIYEPNWIEPYLHRPLDTLLKSLGKRLNDLEDGPVRDEIQGLRGQINGLQQAVARIIELGDEGSVFWAEVTGKRQSLVHLRSAPIDIAPLMREHLLQRQTSVLLTSATLAQGQDMRPFQRAMGGMQETARQVHSPFDYARNMQIWIARDTPQPDARSARLDLAFLADTIAFCVSRVSGGSLVLFTSHADMLAVADRLEPDPALAKRLLLVQGRSGPRQQLARQMREDGHAVLLGTDSFWTGIDIAGPALSQVILTRLPFENPSHPIAEAKAEHIQRQGGNPFAQLTIPQAVTKFRQGVGRLIRSQKDRGLITILDARILHKPYGRTFLASLPHDQFQTFTREDREDRFPILKPANS